jgi:hypothetical protein
MGGHNKDQKSAMEGRLVVDRVRNGQIGGYAKRCLEIDLLPSTPLHDKQASGIEALHDRAHRSRAPGRRFPARQRAAQGSCWDVKAVKARGSVLNFAQRRDSQRAFLRTTTLQFL